MRGTKAADMKRLKNSKKRARHQKPAPTPLDRQVEVIPYSSEDREDSDVLGYVDEFVQDYLSTPPLEPMNLLTQESALQALESIERTRQKIDSQIKTAQALRKLLESKR